MLYHLSHIDLDGFGSQFITKKIFGNAVIFENSNYGLEIKRKLELLLKKIDLNTTKEENTILITDLNLEEDIASWINEEVLKRKNLTLLLIDHHISGEELSKKYDWYFLNTEYCATYLTYRHFKDLIKSKDLEFIKEFAEIVNVTDLHIENDHRFKKATILSNKIFNSYKFPQMLNYLNHDLKLFLIDEYFKLISENLSLRTIELQELNIKEKFLKGKIKEEFLLNEEESIEMKYYYYIFTKLKNFKQEEFIFNGSKGKMYFDIGSGLFQYFANFYNKEIGDVDFLFHVAYNGKMSFRSVGDDIKNDVSKLSHKYFGGGGHVNASGAQLEKGIENKKYNKNEVIKIIENLIEEKDRKED